MRIFLGRPVLCCSSPSGSDGGGGGPAKPSMDHSRYQVTAERWKEKKPPARRKLAWTMYDLELTLEEPDKVYFSGDELRGKVVVNISECLAVQAVIVRFVGEACVSVPERVAEEKANKKRKTPTNKISPAVNVTGSLEAMPCWVEPPGKPTGSPPTPRRSHPQEAHNSQAQVSRPPAAAAKPAKKKKNFLPKGSQKFSSQEKYFFHKEYLYGHKYSSYREKLVGGSHVYGFRFTLPGQLPASFNGRFGYVRYYCECTLLRWKHKDTRRVYFSVTNIADINNEAKAESGCEEQKSTNSCLFCCQRGTVIASAELKRRGYAPGEVAPVTVDIHNMSSSTITSTKAVIVQVVTYSSTQGMRSHTDERRVLEVSRGEVRPGSSRNWSGSGSRGTAAAGIRLPPLPPSSFTVDSCKIISIQYRIEVMMFISGEREALVLKLPLIVGNIPLKKHFPLLADKDEAESFGLVTLPRQVQHRYAALPAVTSKASVNPAQSDCVYKLSDFTPRYLVYIPKTLLH